FIVLGTRSLWENVSYQMVMDITRSERDPMLAAQKLRDFAMAYGACEQELMVLVLGVQNLSEDRVERLRSMKRSSTAAEWLAKKWRRDKNELPGDSTLARLEREVEPPVGQVALVFTDIKNSTFLWEAIPNAMQSAIRIHNGIMRRLLRTIGGYEVKTE